MMVVDNLNAVLKFFSSAEDEVRSFDKSDCQAHFPSSQSIVDF